MKSFNFFFKTSAVLWILWGLVHIFAGIMTMKGVLKDDISASIKGIADAVDSQTIAMEYPEAVGAVIGQHGFNLLWIGLITSICAFFIWKRNKSAIFLAAIIGGFADVGYFLFLDLGGFVNFLPGTIMTLISAAAISASFYGYFKASVISEKKSPKS